MPEPIRGSCLCGAVRFDVAKAPKYMSHCHCSLCRKFHGGAVGTYAVVLREQLRVTAGENRLRRFTTHTGTVRTFCDTCGSSLFADTPQADAFIAIAAGAFDEDPQVRPQLHIHVASMAPWDRITDDLPQVAEGELG